MNDNIKRWKEKYNEWRNNHDFTVYENRDKIDDAIVKKLESLLDEQEKNLLSQPKHKSIGFPSLDSVKELVDINKWFTSPIGIEKTYDVIKELLNTSPKETQQEQPKCTCGHSKEAPCRVCIDKIIDKILNEPPKEQHTDKGDLNRKLGGGSYKCPKCGKTSYGSVQHHCPLDKAQQPQEIPKKVERLPNEIRYTHRTTEIMYHKINDIIDYLNTITGRENNG